MGSSGGTRQRPAGSLACRSASPDPWATQTPPPRHNFTELPRIRSERPAFDLHYPHMVEKWEEDKYAGPFAHQRKPAPSELLAAAVNPTEISKGDPTNRN